MVEQLDVEPVEVLSSECAEPEGADRRRCPRGGIEGWVERGTAWGPVRFLEGCRRVLRFGARHDSWAVAFRQTLTFLFTDVEASTRRWAADRERMSRELAAHDEIMRDLRHGATTRRTDRARRPSG